MATESSRLVLLGQKDGIRELVDRSPPYRLPRGAASLREVLERKDRPYMSGRLLLVTDDFYGKSSRFWYEHPAGLIESGVIADSDTETHRDIRNPFDYVQALLLKAEIEADIEIRNEGKDVVGVYLLRSNPKDKLTIGLGRIIRPQPSEGPPVGIGYVHLERPAPVKAGGTQGGWDLD